MKVLAILMFCTLFLMALDSPTKELRVRRLALLGAILVVGVAFRLLR